MLEFDREGQARELRTRLHTQLKPFPRIISGSMNHIEGKFTGYKNLNLYYHCWLPSNEPKTVLLVTYGLAEHSGRYMNMVNHFVPKGYAVYSLDHRDDCLIHSLSPV